MNLWRGAFLPRGGLFSLGKNARGGISAWAKVPGEAFLPGGISDSYNGTRSFFFFFSVASGRATAPLGDVSLT